MSLIKRIVLTAFLLIIAAFFASCTDGLEEAERMQQSEKDGAGFKIFRTDLSESALMWENTEAPDSAADHMEQIRYVIDKLEADPSDPELKKLLPSSVKTGSVCFGLDGQLIVSFSKEYNNLSTIEELLLRAGYVKTLSQLDFVNYVEFYVDDMPLILRGEVVPGLMKGTDFIDNTGDKSGFSQQVDLTVYFVKKDEKMLGSGMYRVTYDGTSPYEELTISLLVKGPGENDDEFVPTLPENTGINKISSADGIVYVDFDDSFLNFRDEIGEELTIYSVVNTLCDLPGIMKVKITVDGTERKNIDKYGQNGLIERKPELIANEKAGEADG